MLVEAIDDQAIASEADEDGARAGDVPARGRSRARPPGCVASGSELTGDLPAERFQVVAAPLGDLGAEDRAAGTDEGEDHVLARMMVTVRAVDGDHRIKGRH